MASGPVRARMAFVPKLKGTAKTDSHTGQRIPETMRVRRSRGTDAMLLGTAPDGSATESISGEARIAARDGRSVPAHCRPPELPHNLDRRRLPLCFPLVPCVDS